VVWGWLDWFFLCCFRRVGLKRFGLMEKIWGVSAICLVSGPEGGVGDALATVEGLLREKARADKTIARLTGIIARQDEMIAEQAGTIARQAGTIAGQAVEIEGLRGQMEGLRGQMEGLRRENERLAEAEATHYDRSVKLANEVAWLRSRLGKDSRNSSKPPSSDGLKKRVIKSSRRVSGLKPGGQPGHPGRTLALSDNPDEVFEVRPTICGGCQHDLSGIAPERFERRQVFDLPKIRPHVAEYKVGSLRCPNCGRLEKGEAPQGVTRQVQYGPNALALVVYLSVAHHVAVARCAEVMSEVMDLPVSVGTVHKAITTAGAAAMKEFAPWAVDKLKHSDVVHVDETGFNVAGRLAWALVASNDQVTLIDVKWSRTRDAINEIGVLSFFKGVMVHDAAAVYDGYPEALHQLCNAHLLRELEAVVEHHQKIDKEAWCWAEQCAVAIRTAIHHPEKVDEVRQLITSALASTDRLNHPDGALGSAHRALARRIKIRLDDYLRFTHTPGVEPTNNPAEQEIRTFKTKQKVSGCMRTLPGARHFAILRSYISTARKHDTKPLHPITTLLLPDQPTWLPTP